MMIVEALVCTLASDEGAAWNDIEDDEGDDIGQCITTDRDLWRNYEIHHLILR